MSEIELNGGPPYNVWIASEQDGAYISQTSDSPIFYFDDLAQGFYYLMMSDGTVIIIIMLSI